MAGKKMRKRLKKRVHMAINCHPYIYAWWGYCKGTIPIQFMDLAKFTDEENLVTCKACQREVKRQNRLMQGSKDDI
jgi:hypothetical protein